MKTITPAVVRCHGSVSQSLPKPAPARLRPVRRGNFWPGENFTGRTHPWDLVAVVTDQPFVLPAFVETRGGQTH